MRHQARPSRPWPIFNVGQNPTMKAASTIFSLITCCLFPSVSHAAVLEWANTVSRRVTLDEKDKAHPSLTVAAHCSGSALVVSSVSKKQVRGAWEVTVRTQLAGVPSSSFGAKETRSGSFSITIPLSDTKQEVFFGESKTRIWPQEPKP